MKWNVVSMYKDATNIEPFSKEKQSSAGGAVDTAPADVAGADAALNRLTIPEGRSRLHIESRFAGLFADHLG